LKTMRNLERFSIGYTGRSASVRYRERVIDYDNPLYLSAYES